MRRRELVSLLGGATAAWSFAARAQQKSMPVIGSLSIGSPGPSRPYMAAFRQGLSETGYVEGQNVKVEYRWADGQDDRLPALAADLVGRKVDVIAATGGTPAARAAKNATSTIPILFTGNVTGVTLLSVELMSKRFELLSELVPQAKVIALLVNQSNTNSERIVRETQDAARPSGMQLLILKAISESEIDAAFAFLVERKASALIVAPSTIFNDRREQLVALAARHAVPAIYGNHEFTTAGGLVSYGPSRTAVYRQVGIYAGKILKGAKPADLPVAQPTMFELVINLKTAKALGIEIPPTLRERADEVIE
jgi:putative ABC transport system substrate-binding protein